MNKNKRIIVMFFVTSLAVAISLIVGCEKTNSDPCDDTVQPEKAVSLQLTAHILNLNDEPIVGQFVKLETSKIPCGADPKGVFTFEGNTNENGSYTSGVVGYNLRNSDDKVSVFAVAPGLPNFFEQNFSSQEFKYGDFSGMTKKEVHLYIYTQDQK